MRRTPIALAALVALTLAACGGDDDDDDAASSTTSTTRSPRPFPTTASRTCRSCRRRACRSRSPRCRSPRRSRPSSPSRRSRPAAGRKPRPATRCSSTTSACAARTGRSSTATSAATRFPVTLGAGGVIAGWDEGLVGSTAGERRQLDIPSELAYGDQPQGDVIQAGDALTFVIDVLAVVPPTDPAERTGDDGAAAVVGAARGVDGRGPACRRRGDARSRRHRDLPPRGRPRRRRHRVAEHLDRAAPGGPGRRRHGVDRRARSPACPACRSAAGG